MRTDDPDGPDGLFPHRLRSGAYWDMDADAWDHRQRDVVYPKLTVDDPAEAGRIWHPDGTRFRRVVYGREPIALGFVSGAVPVDDDGDRN